MASYIPPPEIQDILERFANTPVEAILHKPYVKLALNKLRFIPITMGITHFLLPEMPRASEAGFSSFRENRPVR